MAAEVAEVAALDALVAAAVALLAAAVAEPAIPVTYAKLAASPDVVGVATFVIL